MTVLLENPLPQILHALPQGYPCPNPCNWSVTIYGKRDFTDVTKDLEIDYCGLLYGQWSQVFWGKSQWMWTGADATTEISGWRDGRKGPSVRKHSWFPEAEKGKRTEGPLRVSRRTTLATAQWGWLWTSDLHNWKITNFVLF